VPPHDDFVCILSRRRDVFASVLSHAVLDITQEPNNYTNKSLAPFAINPDRFHGLYTNHVNFYKNLDLTFFKTKIEIWFEELISDPYYLFRQLGQAGETNYSVIDRSPYNYYELVTNIEQLKQVGQDVRNNINKNYRVAGRKQHVEWPVNHKSRRNQ
jgi:hypothetical protein